MKTCKACDGSGRRMSSNEAGEEYLMRCNICHGAGSVVDALDVDALLAEEESSDD